LDGTLADALDDSHPAVWKQALDGLVALGGRETAAGRKCRLEAKEERLGWFEEASGQIIEAIVGRSR
jgi:hypothetical protein